MYNVSTTDLMLCFSLQENRKTHKANKKNNYQLSGHNSADNFVKNTRLFHQAKKNCRTNNILTDMGNFDEICTHNTIPFFPITALD